MNLQKNLHHLEIIHSLKSKLNPRWKRLKYTVLEPNSIHRDRFLKHLTQISLDDNIADMILMELTNLNF